MKVNNLKTDIDLKNNQVRLKEITAKVNDGDLKIKGYINIPKDFKNFTDSMDYSIDINAKDLKYNDPLIVKISADSKMNISNKKLNGELLINNGIIYDIPNDYKSMWSIISKKILNTKDKKIENEKKKIDSKKKEEGKKKLEKFFEKWNLVNFNVRTQNPVVLDIDDFNIAVGEIKGKLEADLLLTGGKGKYKIEGNTEILNGYLYVNTNKFILDRALISFNDGLSYLPEINPDIFIDSRVTMDEEDINFGVHGRLKKLMYSLSSDSGNINGSFNSLLIDSNKEVNFNGDINRVYVMFMKNIIAGQIAKTVFNPVTKEVKKVLGLSKLIIKPEVSVYNIDSRVAGNNDSGRNTEVYDLGMKVEAEKKLYKDEVYLYGTAKLWGSTKEPVINSSLDKNGIKEYDVGVQYRTKDDKIFGMGVGTIPNRYVNEDRNQKARNYHIDFKIRKKYNSFSEIFSF
nr:translocation/assembly module TamB domain-containing protein [Fusobacterium gastrosuis]